MHGCHNSKKILPGYLHRSYRGSTRALVARIHHNLEFDNRYCNSYRKYKMRSDDFTPYKLIQSHRCSGFCLPSSAHSLKNENKLSMEISCQLFLNKQYKLLNNYVKLTWGKNWRCIHKDKNRRSLLRDCRITKIHDDKHTLIKTIHIAKCFPIFATKMGYTPSIVQLYLKIHTMMGP